VAEVTGKTAAAMDAIANASITGGTVNSSGHLVLTDHGGGTHDAGSVVGPTGSMGSTGPAGPAGIMPTGTIIMFATGGPPAGGWLVCNGMAVSRTTYSALFALLGTRYGPGDGTTTFNVPNMSNRFPRMDASYGTNAGVTGGADVHTHTVATHDHTIEGGSTDATAHVSIASVAAPNIYMERITSTAWNVTNSGDVTTTSSSGANQTSGAKVTGHTAIGGPSVSGSTLNDPPFLNVAFFIKY